MHNMAEQKNIPPRNRGEMRQSRRGLPRRPGRGVLRLILFLISLLVDGSSIRILIHADSATIFPGAARIAAQKQEKSPSRRPGRGVLK